MTTSRHDDEALLIDFVLGRCDQEQSREVRQRLQQDEPFSRLHDDLRNTFSALELAVDHEPPAGLVESTLNRLRSAKQTNALLAREQLSRRDVIRPTFSLRELAAIAGVVLLVVSIFGVSYREAEQRKMRDDCAMQQARIGSALQSYAIRSDGWLPSTGDSQRRWLPAGDRPAVSNSKGLFALVRDGYVEPPTFQCPAVGGESFAVQAGMTDFPSSKFVNYSYQYSLGPKGLWLHDRRIADVKASLAILADENPVFENGRFRRDRVRAPVSHNHDSRGQNVLYLPGNVEFQPRPSVGVRGDNIYLAEGVYEYSGEEAPAGPTDTFLLPAFPQPAGPTDERRPDDLQSPR
jgi:hypothetical protein